MVGIDFEKLFRKIMLFSFSYCVVGYPYLVSECKPTVGSDLALHIFKNTPLIGLMNEMFSAGNFTTDKPSNTLIPESGLRNRDGNLINAQQ